MAGNIAGKVYDLVKDAVKEQGVELWDVKYVKEGASWYLRIFIDSENGINIDDCTNVSHAVDPILDEHDPIDNSYYLEVSSPGLMREINRDEHFAWALGKDVKVKLYKALNGTKELGGKLVSHNDSEIVLQVADEQIALPKGSYSSVRLDDDHFNVN
ncbi:MAG: ribosome maturation factor RimP [Clostridia bacterium]|nr:ribosome maturation factor RimP [Clostridia bacterium]